jgi:ubiquinone/menaquinone biosynthesis C-methylase UbiE
VIVMRLGTYYKDLIWNRLGIRATGNRVLDIGGFDGYWLSKQPAKIKVCADINPQRQYANITYVQTDALDLPFEDGYFDQVFAFDLIEHVNNDKQLLIELHRVTKPNGQIIITTPHKNILIFPSFLTNWVSKKWGHYRVNGYLENELKEIIPDNDIAEFLFLRELFFRTFYLPLRLLWALSDRICRPIVKMIAYFDSYLLMGSNGHIVISLKQRTL